MVFGRTSKAERLIIGYIEKNFTDSDGDLDEEIQERLEILQQALQEAGLTIEDLALNLEILRFCTYSDFEEIIEYIRKKERSVCRGIRWTLPCCHFKGFAREFFRRKS